MEYRTKTVELQRGLIVGEVQHLDATIREMIVDDLLQIKEGQSEMQSTISLLTNRVQNIGTVEKPDEMIIRKLTAIDFNIIAKAAEALDAESQQMQVGGEAGEGEKKPSQPGD